MVLVVVYITKGQRRIPVQYAKLTRGRKVYGGQRHYMPIRVNQASVMTVGAGAESDIGYVSLLMSWWALVCMSMF